MDAGLRVSLAHVVQYRLNSDAVTVMAFKCSAANVHFKTTFFILCIGLRCVSYLFWRQHVTDPCQIWNGTFFQRITPKQLGVRVQLGHNPGERCYKPSPAAGDDFVVIALDGIHEIALDFCGCASAQIRYKQLLRMRWYPATVSEPRTAATFTVLQHFHILSFESKVSAYEFYQSLARRTDNSGLVVIRVSILIYSCNCLMMIYSRISIPLSCGWYANGVTSNNFPAEEGDTTPPVSMLLPKES